ncbi:MAG: hypothetical protein JNJ59_27820, partial [Deltaproteobacteria bacterium]|nr:hypothetical protein [Deltaproteobacteria bacterium]
GRMAFIQLEDLTGRIEVLVFTKAFPSFEPHLSGDEPIIVRGRLTREGEDEENMQLKLRAEECRLLRDARAERTSRARIRLPADTVTPAHLKHLGDMLKGVAGVPVEMIVAVRGKGEASVRLGQDWMMPMDDEVVARVERLVGKGAVAFF